MRLVVPMLWHWARYQRRFTWGSIYTDFIWNQPAYLGGWNVNEIL